MSTICRFPGGPCAAALLLIIGLGTPACGGDAGGSPTDARLNDARDPNAPDARTPCYSGGGTPTPGAQVELGTGRVGFTLLNEDDELDLYAGNQGGYHVFVQARIHGLSAGARDQPPEENPATWFRAFNEDGDDITVRPCSYPVPYELDAEGEYIMPYAHILQITTTEVPDIYGRRMRILAEVMDGEGRYARDEEWVVIVAAEKPDASVPEERPDAGVPDASVPDASASTGN